jgi:prepilin-type N-terminal cleavage/methylation domain-containing protein
MYKRCGFTLIELLVVIAIIALLMSILMPALARVRKQAKEAICQSNLKQWGTAFSMYTGDWDGSFHMGWSSGRRHRWYLALRTYYGNETDLLLCPMATKPYPSYGSDPSGGSFNTWTGGTYDWEGDRVEYYGSYGQHSCLPNFKKHDDDQWRRDDVKGGGNIPLLVDAQWFTNWAWWGNDPPEYEGARWRSGASGGGMGGFCIPRHGETVNGVFFDRSVRSIGLKELWLLKWCRSYDVGRARDNEPDWENVGTGWMARFSDYNFATTSP